MHPSDEQLSWLLHTRRVHMVPNSRKAPQSSAEQPAAQSSASAAQPALQYKCAGVGDIDAVAYICYDCATCLCAGGKLINMPRFTLANAMWLGRQHRLLQPASLGRRLLLGLGRPVLRKLLLGPGHRGERESGTTGNHVLVSQGSPSISEVLPPSPRQLSDSVVAILDKTKRVCLSVRC